MEELGVRVLWKGVLEERDIAFSLGHSIDYSPRIKKGNVPEGYGYRGLGQIKSLFLPYL
jgi:hypothetical protein